jgi:hypothetical protein
MMNAHSGTDFTAARRGGSVVPAGQPIDRQPQPPYRNSACKAEMARMRLMNDCSELSETQIGPLQSTPSLVSLHRGTRRVIAAAGVDDGADSPPFASAFRSSLSSREQSAESPCRECFSACLDLVQVSPPTRPPALLPSLDSLTFTCIPSSRRKAAVASDRGGRSASRSHRGSQAGCLRLVAQCRLAPHPPSMRDESDRRGRGRHVDSDGQEIALPSFLQGQAPACTFPKACSDGCRAAQVT